MIYKWNPVDDRDTVEGQINALARELMTRGVQAMSYHIAPPFHSQVSFDCQIYHYGYANDIVQLYREPDVFENDPIPDHVIKIGHVMTWRQAAEDQTLTEDQRAFLKNASRLGLSDGVAVPLFGPAGRNSYLSLNLGRLISADDESLVRPLVSMAQSCHRRICTIISRQNNGETLLSSREREVLQWISRGKSNSEIALMLDLSESTIDTYVRRVFVKLDVHDRVSAAIHGLAKSLIQFG